jgi:hypothetical protein
MQRKPPAKRLFSRMAGSPLAPVAETPTAESAQATVVTVNPLKGTAINENDLRNRFGVEERKTGPKLPESYRKFFDLEPEDLIGFFDTQIGSYTDLVQVEFIISSSMIQHRLRRLQKTINYVNEIIKGLSVGAMKTRRGKENVLDKPTREKYKREEQARLARCYAKRAKYYAAEKQEKYVEKVWRIVEKPIYFRDMIDDRMVFTNVVETKWVEHADMWLDGEFRNDVTDVIETLNHGQFDLDGYKKVMKLGFAALAELGETHEEMQKAWKNLQHWENAVIAAAIRYRVIQPRHDLAVLVGLDKVIANLNDQVAMEDFEQRDMNPEDVLALKTGGKCFFGRMRIQSEGFRYRANGTPVPRPLSNFDKPTRMTGPKAFVG